MRIPAVRCGRGTEALGIAPAPEMLAPNESKGAEFSHSRGRKRRLLLVSLDVRCWSRRTGLGLSKGRAAHETEGGDSNNELPHLKLLFGLYEANGSTKPRS